MTATRCGPGGVGAVIAEHLLLKQPPIVVRPYAVVRRTRRRGARGGGTCRVRAPAGRRLCVLRQIGDELVAGVEQFLLVDDVVAVDDGAARVAGQAHGTPFGDAGAGAWHACSGPWCHPWRCGRVCAAGWRVWPQRRYRAPWADCGLGGARSDARFVRQVRALAGCLRLPRQIW